MNFDRYEREDMLRDLTDFTKEHAGVRKPVTWICDCGCDIAQWYQRTNQGLAWTQQAWPRGMTPFVMLMTTREHVEKFVDSTVSRMRMRMSGDVAAGERRIASFKKAVWSAWADD